MQKIYSLEPPITRHLKLPEKVAVRYIAELSRRMVSDIVGMMQKFGVFVTINRSLDFDDAARILRGYGIQAEREPER